LQAGQVRNDLRLAFAKALLAFDFEDRRQADACTSLDLVVRIDKRYSQTPGQGFADRRLSGPHQADQVDVAFVVVRFSQPYSIAWSTGIIRGPTKSRLNAGPLPMPGAGQRTARFSATILGVTKTSSSVLSSMVSRFLNRKPT
jgi:hypothetical protein